MLNAFVPNAEKEDFLEGVRATPKTHNGRFYACPMSTITEGTWSIIRLVNRTTDEYGRVINNPFPGSYLEQPQWYRDAVDIVMAAKAEKQKIDLAKRKQNGSR